MALHMHFRMATRVGVTDSTSSKDLGSEIATLERVLIADTAGREDDITVYILDLHINTYEVFIDTFLLFRMPLGSLRI
jgi:hypothetical protein